MARFEPHSTLTLLLDLHSFSSMQPLFLVDHQLRSTNKRQYPFRYTTDNGFGIPLSTVMEEGRPPGDPAPPCSVRSRGTRPTSRWSRGPHDGVVAARTPMPGRGGAHRSMPVAPAGTS